MRRKRIMIAGLVFGLIMGQAAVFGGCGSQSELSDEVIELIEPKAEYSGGEAVARRTLAVAQVYTVMVDPYVENYSYEESRINIPTGLKVGDEVKKGQVLYRADKESANKKIEELQEKMDALTESYEEYRKDLEEKLYIQRLELEDLEEQLENVQEAEPQVKLGAQYEAWRKEYGRIHGAYNKKELDINVNEEDLRQRTELYRLDYDYYDAQKKTFLAQNEAGVIRSGLDGVLIGLDWRMEGNYVPSGWTVAAVADMNQKQISCEKIKNGILLSAKEIYAFFNGKKYEVVYDEKAGDSATTVFRIQDPDGEVSVGDYGSLVLFTNLARDVLTVPNEAIQSVGLDKHVYVIADGEITERPVKVGMTDGVYTQILSGLEEGEQVFLDRSTPQAVHTAELGRSGASKEVTYKNCYMNYPKQYAVKSEVENGTVVFMGWAENVTLKNPFINAYVTLDSITKATGAMYSISAGTAVANISVKPSAQEQEELAQKEIELARARDRLADLVAEGTEGKEKIIESRQEAIDKLDQEVVKLKSDYATTTVRADRDGMLYFVSANMYDSSGKSLEVKVGDEMTYDFNYATIVDRSMGKFYLEKDNTDKLPCNAVVKVRYQDIMQQMITAELPLCVLDGGSTTYTAYVYEDVIQNMSSSIWNPVGVRLQNSFDVSVEVWSVDNVVALPEIAAYKTRAENSWCYVNVLMEDGSVKPTGVLLGEKFTDESGASFYWVIEGLTEGMTVCWE